MKVIGRDVNITFYLKNIGEMLVIIRATHTTITEHVSNFAKLNSKLCERDYRPHRNDRKCFDPKFQNDTSRTAMTMPSHDAEEK